MKPSFLLAAFLSAVTSVTAVNPFNAKFSHESFEKWANYLVNDETLDYEYRQHHGYEDNKQLNPDCPPHLKDNAVYLLMATGRYYDGGKVQYMQDLNQVNYVDLKFSVKQGNKACGIIGVKTTYPPSTTLSSPHWGTPLFIAEDPQSIHGGYASKLEDITLSGSDALVKGGDKILQLKAGFKEVILNNMYFYNAVQPLYNFIGLKQAMNVGVMVGSGINYIDIFEVTTKHLE